MFELLVGDRDEAVELVKRILAGKQSDHPGMLHVLNGAHRATGLFVFAKDSEAEDTLPTTGGLTANIALFDQHTDATVVLAMLPPPSICRERNIPETQPMLFRAKRLIEVVRKEIASIQRDEHGTCPWCHRTEGCECDEAHTFPEPGSEAERERVAGAADTHVAAGDAESIRDAFIDHGIDLFRGEGTWNEKQMRGVIDFICERLTRAHRRARYMVEKQCSLRDAESEMQRREVSANLSRILGLDGEHGSIEVHTMRPGESKSDALRRVLGELEQEEESDGSNDDE
jgi:hypothetical protein